MSPGRNFILVANKPAVILAPMEGVTDFSMRALLSARGGFSYCVSEFFRVSQDIPAPKAFYKHVPELHSNAKTSSGVPVQLQILGGDPGRMAQAAFNATLAGAKAIDLNFGCPAPCVNKSDGGATLLKHPERIYAVVSEVRKLVPKDIPVSAKLRLGWENPEDIFVNAEQAAKGGANWITIHARTKTQGYRPPVFWKYIKEVKNQLSVPVVANGDIWTFEDFLKCQETTDCIHFMIGRGALASPTLPLQMESYLNTGKVNATDFSHTRESWKPLLEAFSQACQLTTPKPNYAAARIKQWLTIAAMKNPAEWISQVKQATTLEQIFQVLS